MPKLFLLLGWGAAVRVFRVHCLPSDPVLMCGRAGNHWHVGKKQKYSHSFEKVDSERNENIGWRTDDWRLRLGGRKVRGVHNVLHAKGASGVWSSAMLLSKFYPSSRLGVSPTKRSFRV